MYFLILVVFYSLIIFFSLNNYFFFHESCLGFLFRIQRLYISVLTDYVYIFNHVPIFHTSSEHFICIDEYTKKSSLLTKNIECTE